MKFQNMMYIAMVLAFIFIFFIPLCGLDSLPLIKNLYSAEEKECETINVQIKSINGIEDINTGLFSGGSVYRKNILFDNGMVVEFKNTELSDELIIRGNYTYEKCVIKSGGFNLFSFTNFTYIKKRLIEEE